MKFLDSQEKRKLRDILSQSSHLQTAGDRTNFLKICGLDSYCSSIQVDKTFDNFFTNLITVLCKMNIKDKNSESKLDLVVFLEHFIDLEDNLSLEDKDLIQYLIQKCNKKTSIRTNPQLQNEFLLISDLSIKQDHCETNEPGRS